MTTFTNKAQVVQGMKNLLNLIKTTTSNEEQFKEEFVSTLLELKKEYQEIRLQTYTKSNQVELAKKNSDIANAILEELNINTLNQKKSKSRINKTKEVFTEESTLKEENEVTSLENEKSESVVELVFSKEDEVNE